MLRVKIYHIHQGEVEMYVVDANQALALHPDEWSREPWGAGEPSLPVGDIQVAATALSPLDPRSQMAPLASTVQVVDPPKVKATDADAAARQEAERQKAAQDEAARQAAKGEKPDLDKLTDDELRAFVKDRGGDVRGNLSRDTLMARAKERQAAG